MKVVLLIMLHVGPLGDGNSNALTIVDGFSSLKTCEEAASFAKTVSYGTVKEVKTKCLEVK